MTDSGDLIGDLERQRLKLEDNVSSLKKSLYHWRLWEAEYDGLREEVAALKGQGTQDDILRTGREFGGTLVNEEEIKKLLKGPQGVLRSREQVVDLISRRIDYVQTNVKVFEKRILMAEGKLNALLSAEESSLVKQDTLPVTEIFEELDDDDQVISSSTTTPNQAAPMIMDVLKKAGVDTLPKSSRDTQQPSRIIELGDTKMLEETPSARGPGGEESNSVQEKTASKTSSENCELALPSFSQDSVASVSNVSTHGSSPRDIADDSAQGNEDSEDDIPTIVNVNESPEEAALRQEMMQYGLEEVGAVVAELDLEEDGSEFSLDDEDEYDYMEGETDDEDEDEHGRTTRRVINDDYRKHMLELEKKLNAKGLQNIGPDSSALPNDVREELEKPSAMKTDVPEEAAPKVPKKKKVAFAEDLDIAPAHEPPSKVNPQPAPSLPPRPSAPKELDVPAVLDAVVERGESAKDLPTDTKPPKKVSRFKIARSSGVPVMPDYPPATDALKPRPSPANPGLSSLPLFPARPPEPKPFSQPIDEPTDTMRTEVSLPPPTFPEGATLADNVFEREPSKVTTAPDPDELDENLHRQEIATEFYKMRNRKVQASGGFVDEEEEERVPIEEPTRKISRFMAARTK